jgi:hypothetical protein
MAETLEQFRKGSARYIKSMLNSAVGKGAVDIFTHR